MVVMADQYNDTNDTDREKLYHFLNGNSDLPVFSGDLTVENGEIENELSIINARSVAENVKVYDSENKLYSGKIEITNGKYTSENGVTFQGNSLMHSAPLTAEAFTRSLLGDWGKWIVSIGLLLFAFSTAIAWAYYGGRSVTYLFGVKGVLPYRIIYCIGFFIASFADTTIIWTISGITIVLMALPNLIGILMLHKDMKSTLNAYWDKFKKEYPSEV